METKLIKRTQKFKVGGQILFAKEGAITGPSFDDILMMYQTQKRQSGDEFKNYVLDNKTKNSLKKQWKDKTGREELINSYNTYMNRYNQTFDDYALKAISAGGADAYPVATSYAPGSEEYNKIYTDQLNRMTPEQKATAIEKQKQLDAMNTAMEATFDPSMQDLQRSLTSSTNEGDLENISAPETVIDIPKWSYKDAVRWNSANSSKWKNYAKRANEIFGTTLGIDLTNPEEVVKWQMKNGLTRKDADGLIGQKTWDALVKATGIKETFNPAPVKPAGEAVTPPANKTPVPPKDEVSTGDFPVVRKYNVTIGGKSESLTREDAINKHGQGIVKYLDDADNFYDNPDDYLTESTYQYNFTDNSGKAQSLNFNINSNGTYTLGEGKTAETGLIPKGAYDNNKKLRNFNPLQYNVGYSIPAISNMMNIRSKSNYNRK